MIFVPNVYLLQKFFKYRTIFEISSFFLLKIRSHCYFYDKKLLSSSLKDWFAIHAYCNNFFSYFFNDVNHETATLKIYNENCDDFLYFLTKKFLKVQVLFKEYVF